MRRAILPALALLLLALQPSSGQYGRYGARDASRTVAGWYQRFLGRQADPYAGSWVDALRRGQDPDQVLSGILGSDEYYLRAGGRPADFVRQLYDDLTGREPSPGQLRHWVQQMRFQSRGDVAYAILTRGSRNWDDRDDRDRYSDRYDYRRPYNPYR